MISKIDSNFGGYLHHIRQLSRAEKINNIVAAVKQLPQQEVEWEDFSRICAAKGIVASSLSEGELDYINQRILDNF